ncbi:integration host factor subunit beta [Haemophilus paracuniculus]|uniref:Integration host factor subunit beta n=1 Tax=Haemophilus paracuniculus TaxID=734 RepID=A0A1T0AUZ9_9PAST|nr:integration host factor subunit beta [Haemophilus paracuniculus]OOS00605.1 integration host factor subunit beta [Haemophilus paracuniculus]
MTKSELIDRLVSMNPALQVQAVEDGVKTLLEQITCSLEQNQRVEVRGFGSFSLHHRKPRQGRNPKTGEQVALSAKAVPHFKAGKELKERVDR